MIFTAKEYAGQLIRTKRIFLGITPEEFAKELDCSKSYVINIENGHANLNEHKIRQISDILKIPANKISVFLNNSGIETDYMSLKKNIAHTVTAD